MPPSPMIGGHQGGTIQGVFGIVELEDGTIKRVYPYEIRFMDNFISQYGFEKEVQEDAGADNCPF